MRYQAVPPDTLMRFRFVAVGVSTGGLAALETILNGIPPDFPLPITIVQHRSRESGKMLCTMLARYSRLPVREPQDKEDIVAGHVYLAPADYHLLVEAGAFALSTEGPVLCARPSVDVFFLSVAEAYAESAIGVVLTGASADGALG